MAVVDNVLFIFMDDIILGMLWCVLDQGDSVFVWRNRDGNAWRLTG